MLPGVACHIPVHDFNVALACVAFACCPLAFFWGGVQEAELVPVTQQGELTQYPDQPGVYAVYDQARHLQYVGLTLKVRKAAPRQGVCTWQLDLRT